MRQSVHKLENFYTSRLGHAAQGMAVRRLYSLWPHMEGLDVLAYGYGIPYLASYEKSAHRIIYAMPSGQGAVRHGARRGNSCLLVGGHELPFQPSLFDRVLVVHGAEEAQRFPALLGELWRVMKPEGRIVIIAANRAGLWARSDKTPFGSGRPFSRTQLSMALKEAGFVPSVRSGALYCPPVKSLCGARTAPVFEKFGETVWPGFSGLVLVEAVKRLYAGREGREKKRVLRPSFGKPLGASGKIYQPRREITKRHEKV